MPRLNRGGGGSPEYGNGKSARSSIRIPPLFHVLSNVVVMFSPPNVISATIVPNKVIHHRQEQCNSFCPPVISGNGSGMSGKCRLLPRMGVTAFSSPYHHRLLLLSCLLLHLPCHSPFFILPIWKAARDMPETLPLHSFTLRERAMSSRLCHTNYYALPHDTPRCQISPSIVPISCHTPRKV